MPSFEDEVSTIASLLVKVKDPGDEPAWEAFVRRYEGPICRWCRSKGLGPEATDSVSQRVLVKLLKLMQASAYDARRGSFRTWPSTTFRARTTGRAGSRCRSTFPSTI